MSDWKEVWYVWDGDTENREMSFVQYVKGIQFGGGEVVDEDDMFFYRDPSKIYTLWTAWGKLDYTIVAYTLGEKRRRVECGCCGGSGFNDDVFNEIGIESDCVVCGGTGKVWEYE